MHQHQLLLLYFNNTYNAIERETDVVLLIAIHALFQRGIVVKTNATDKMFGYTHLMHVHNIKDNFRQEAVEMPLKTVFKRIESCNFFSAKPDHAMM